MFASKVGTPLGARNVRRAFRSIIKRAGIAGEWTPREPRTSFVSLLSETGMAIEETSHLVGHSSTVVTETVYRLESRPVIRAVPESGTGTRTVSGAAGTGRKPT